jgi:acyl carrier protein
MLSLMGSSDDLAETIGAYILEEFLPGEPRENLTASTPLISTGILDSIALLRLVGFLEETCAITIASHEVDADHFETIQAMVDLVRAKQSP